MRQSLITYFILEYLIELRNLDFEVKEDLLNPLTTRFIRINLMSNLTRLKRFSNQMVTIFKADLKIIAVYFYLPFGINC